MALYDFDALRAGVTTGILVTSGASSAVVAIPANSSGIVPAVSLLSATANLHVKLGVGQPISSVVTITAAGSAYAAVATVSFAAPLAVTGGVTATGHARMKVNTISSIAAGGATYTQNDVLTVVGGTGTAATITATTVVGGAITVASVTTAGQYTVLPASPVSVTGGTGTGATFNLTWAVDSIVVDNVGANYSVAPVITVSGNGTATSALASTIFVATANDLMITANSYLPIFTKGNLYVAYIQETAGAKLLIAPCEV